MKLLIIEDNPRLADRIKNLMRKHHLVEFATSGDEALSVVTTQIIDVIILDLGLPDMHGLEVCRKIRGLAITTPILVLTGVDNFSAKIDLLDAGADDYMTKPFDSGELNARVNALNRRRNREQLEESICVADLILNPSQRTVTRDGTLINLRRKEFDILEYLLRNQGRVLSRQMIINHAWTTATATWTGSVDVHIKQLRDKVDKPFQTKLIKTTYGVGYSIEKNTELSNVAS